MKKGLMMALTAICMMIGTSVFAQKAMVQTEEMARKRADKLKSELSLTDQQTQQVYQQLVWNMEQKKENAQEAWTKTDAKMKEVLTPEQYAKWSQMQKEKMDRAKEKAHTKMKEGKEQVDKMMK